MEMAGVDQRLVAAVLAALEQQGYRVEAPAAAQEATCTVAEMWTAWAVWAEQHLKSWRAKRYHNRCLLRTIVGGRPLGEYRWDEVTPGVCDEYRRVREGTKSLFGRFVKPNTVNGELVTLQMIFTWHVSEGKIPRNPMKGWKREDEKK